MAEDNTPLEKISLNSSDFSENLGNNFGIEDTKLLASEELSKFLTSDPDEIKNVANEKRIAEEKAKELKEKENQNQGQKSEEKKAKPDGKTALEKVLFETEDNEEDNTDPNKQEITSNNKLDNVTSPEDIDYTTLGKDLLRLGIFSKSSDDETEETLNIKNPEEFLERWSTEKKKGAVNILDNFLSQFGEDYRKMFDAVFVNGVNPQEYIDSFAKIESISNLDITNEDNQARVVRAYYKSLKWDEEKIDSRIKKLKDYGDLEDEAKTYQEVLVNREKESATNLEAKKIEEKRVQDEKDVTLQKSFQRILNEKLKEREIDGIPLTNEDAQKVFAYMVNKPYKLASGELITEYDKYLMELNRPENHENKIKLGLLMMKKLDLTSIKKATISKKSDALFTLSTKNSKEKQEKKEQKSFFN